MKYSKWLTMDETLRGSCGEVGPVTFGLNAVELFAVSLVDLNEEMLLALARELSTCGLVYIREYFSIDTRQVVDFANMLWIREANLYFLAGARMHGRTEVALLTPPPVQLKDLATLPGMYPPTK